MGLLSNDYHLALYWAKMPVDMDSKHITENPFSKRVNSLLFICFDVLKVDKYTLCVERSSFVNSYH